MRQYLDKSWRLHPKVRWTILGVVVLAQLVLLFVPKGWEVVRAMSLGVNLFMGGLYVAGELAIWEHAPQAEQGPDAATKQNED